MRASWRNEGQRLRMGGPAKNTKRYTLVKASDSALAEEIKKIVQAGSHRSVVKTATLISVEGQEEAVKKMCMKFVEDTKKVMEDEASGIISFECHTDAYEQGVFHFWERYKTNTYMGNYNSTKDAQKFTTDVRPLLQSPIAMVLYEYTEDGNLGPMANCIGPTGEGGLDDATGGTKGSGGGIQHAQTSNALQGGLVNLEKDDRKMHVVGNAGVNLGEIAEKAKKLFGGLGMKN